ncbi:hypothetical protein Pmani_033483 [Petrolisthes manimaculis]|uniref:AB hydrolase-1 domain-containing protein n=1 Tax=Petrolisthes manimaculis TaxID=1843537 RepID=A0AAE1TQC8_9EUCA|nr:hypothetical protein Pmani_033483 [Petrolisthes manimaculis]
MFAIHSLGFKEEDIIIFGWSIGGYTSTWAAMNYPKIAGLILDASFDDILPLAKYAMPDFLSPSVTLAIKRYFNLRPGAQLVKYHGPVTIVRRTQDDKVTTDQLKLSCNRGNNLLLMLLQSRYPKLFTTISTRVLQHMLAQEPVFIKSIMKEYHVDDNQCSCILDAYITHNGISYPMTIGENMNIHEKTQLLLYLSSKYLLNLNNGHNFQLPHELFRQPWNPLFDK